MTTEQPLALKLADVLDLLWLDGQTPRKAAAELRRLLAENAELTENLEKKSAAIQRIWKERDELRNENEELRGVVTWFVDQLADDSVDDMGKLMDALEKKARAALTGEAKLREKNGGGK